MVKKRERAVGHESCSHIWVFGAGKDLVMRQCFSCGLDSLEIHSEFIAVCLHGEVRGVEGIAARAKRALITLMKVLQRKQMESAGLARPAPSSDSCAWR